MSRLLPGSSVSLMFNWVALACVALFQIINPDPGLPLVIVVFAL